MLRFENPRQHQMAIEQRAGQANQEFIKADQIGRVFLFSQDVLLLQKQLQGGFVFRLLTLHDRDVVFQCRATSGQVAGFSVIGIDLVAEGLRRRHFGFQHLGPGIVERELLTQLRQAFDALLLLRPQPGLGGAAAQPQPQVVRPTPLFIAQDARTAVLRIVRVDQVDIVIIELDAIHPVIHLGIQLVFEHQQALIRPSVYRRAVTLEA